MAKKNSQRILRYGIVRFVIKRVLMFIKEEEKIISLDLLML